MSANTLSNHLRRSGPCVTIGLPVYNGELHLRSAIDSILAQTFTDFELIIADNASTDGTEAICQDYAARDSRVRYYRNEKNLGISRNFNLTFERATGRYFKWAAHDDVLEPEFLSHCVQVLEANPGVVLCHSHVRIINGSGHAIVDYGYREDYASAGHPSRRFRDVLAEDRWGFELFGVVRTDAMRKTRLLDRFVGADRIFRAELALLGSYCIVPEFLFLNRDHPGRSIRMFPAHHLRGKLFDPSVAGRRIFPHWRILLEYARCINRVPIHWSARVACYALLGRWLAQHHNWARLLVDIVIAAVPSSWQFFLDVTDSSVRWLSGRVGKNTGTHDPQLSQPGHAPWRSTDAEDKLRASSSGPELSVILVTDSYSTIRTELASLRAQTVRDRLEIVVVTASAEGLGPAGGACEGFHSVTVVGVRDIYPLFLARSQGIRAANAPIVLIAQSHAYLAPLHCEVVIRAHGGPWAVVGPAMCNANPATMRSWSALFLDYGPWIEPGNGGVVDRLPGINSSYKRTILLEYGDRLESMMLTSHGRHTDLRARGHQFYLEPAARTFHLNTSLPYSWLEERLVGGRAFAGARALHWNRSRRLAYAIASPLIPIVRFPRIVRHMRRAFGPGFIIRSLPVMGVSLLVSAVGEGFGYAFGMGGALNRANEMELYKKRHVLPSDRAYDSGVLSANDAPPT